MTDFQKQDKQRQKIGGEVNYMQYHKFKRLVDIIDLTPSQKRNVKAMFRRIDRQIEKGMIKPDKQAILFSIPQKIGGKLWLTIRSRTINDSLLCLTDEWYAVKLGKRGKVQIELDRWDKPKESFYYLF